MLKKRFIELLVLPLVLTLAACGSTAVAATSTTAQPLEQKLAVGTLKLEGTANAVTADQAKTLLPLWRAVKSLSSSSTASTAEINAVYQQIESGMTEQQIQAIKGLNLSQTDMQALMKQYNIQASQMPASQGTPAAQGTPRAQSQSSSSSAQAGDAGVPPDLGAGGPSGDLGGVIAGGGQSGSSGTAQGTPQANRIPRAGGMNTMFIDPLITILEQRAGA